MSTPVSTTVRVQGMTCEHCVASVTEELSTLPGVQDVQVDLVPDGDSAVTVTSEAPLDEQELQKAVEDAGYSLV